METSQLIEKMKKENAKLLQENIALKRKVDCLQSEILWQDYKLDEFEKDETDLLMTQFELVTTIKRLKKFIKMILNKKSKKQNKKFTFV